ncbi:unnamed protein product [Eruca vesicaria subsp. sativa]|uniref:F-box domain-containing protein n=1 Tax=Eruca vesicaria subsp. sativa TaxID=29727 RepID=A0ABC8KK81_ERUVS|nr:unnamed protein product [Eruca vesicaria subsp. sativa]
MSSTVVASDQEAPSKKPATEPTSIMQLPDELVLSCLARVSRLHYPILSLVSKTFRSLTSSPELHETRYLLNRTENCLYVCIQFPTESNHRWFTLCRKPDKTLTNQICKKKETESSSGNVLVPVQILNSPPVEWSNLVAVGHKLYAINKEEDDPSSCSSSVFFLDCRTHTWVETPILRLAHTDGGLNMMMMYLAGSNETPDSLNCVQVFNAKTQTWKPVPPEKRIFRATDYEGKVYKNFDADSGKRVMALKLKDATVDLAGPDIICSIEKRFYCYEPNGEFRWSNHGTELDGWKKVEGLEGMPKFAHYSNVNLVECGGKMMVFWDKYVPARGGYKEKMIWCAEISLEMRSSEEVWGKVEWFDAVLKVPKSYNFVYASSVTV